MKKHKQQIKKTIGTIKKDPKFFATIAAYNALFWIALYWYSTAFSVWVSKNYIQLSEAARQYSLKPGVLLVLIVGLIILPLIIYILTRLYIHKTISLKLKSKLKIKYDKQTIIKWLVAFTKLIGVFFAIGFVWSLVLIVINKEIVGYVVVVSAIPLLVLAYLWIQAMVLSKVKSLKQSFRNIKPIALQSISLGILAAIFIILSTFLFYIFGSLWAGSFSKQVLLTTAEWNRYALIYEIINGALLIGLVSFAQIHYGVGSVMSKSKTKKKTRTFL